MQQHRPLNSTPTEENVLHMQQHHLLNSMPTEQNVLHLQQSIHAAQSGKIIIIIVIYIFAIKSLIARSLAHGPHRIYQGPWTSMPPFYRRNSVYLPLIANTPRLRMPELNQNFTERRQFSSISKPSNLFLIIYWPT